MKAKATIITSLLALVLILLGSGPVMAIDYSQQQQQRRPQVMLDMLKRLDTLQQEVQQLRDQSERNAHDLEQLKKRQKQLYIDVDRRLQALEKGGGNRPPPDVNAGAPQPRAPGTRNASDTAAPPKPTPTGDRGNFERAEFDAYNQAFTLIKQGDYEQAKGALRQFINRHPQSTYAANAQYWLGEANYVTEHFDIALREFKKVVDQYPQSSKVPAALLKQGFTYYQRQDWQQARDTLQYLRNRYPNARAANKAQQRLERMSQEGR